jgi:hypothetical protein
MHHVDLTPSAADIARPSAPSDVTVALETRAGCLRAYHRRPGRAGDLGYPVAQPSPPRRVPTLVLPAVQAEPATRSASTPTADPREPTTSPTFSTPTPDTVPLAVSRPTTPPGPARAQAPATAGTTTITRHSRPLALPPPRPPVTSQLPRPRRPPPPRPPPPSRPPPSRRSLNPLARVSQQTGSGPSPTEVP